MMHVPTGYRELGNEGRAGLDESLYGAGRGAARQAHTLQSGEWGGKGMLAP